MTQNNPHEHGFDSAEDTESSALPELTAAETAVAQAFNTTVYEFPRLHNTQRVDQVPSYMYDAPVTGDSTTVLKLEGGGTRKVLTTNMGWWSCTMRVIDTAPNGAMEHDLRLSWHEARQTRSASNEDGRVYVHDALVPGSGPLPIGDPDEVEFLRVQVLGLAPLVSTDK